MHSFYVTHYDEMTNIWHYGTYLGHRDAHVPLPPS